LIYLFIYLLYLGVINELTLLELGYIDNQHCTQFQ